MITPKLPLFPRRLWLPAVFLIVFLVSFFENPTWLRALTSTRNLIIFYMLWQNLENNARAFLRIHAADEERFLMTQGTRKATETLATTLEIIRAELAKNTSITSQGAHASAVAAKVALTTVAEIAVSVANVHTAADAAFQEANDVNKKIANFNERLLTAQTNPALTQAVRDAFKIEKSRD